jgi:methylenetetrahydrofolate dehydrogenase (NADP+)/methenyltetrahydrofolate cyclohydrolase
VVEGEAVVMDGARLRDEIVARLRAELGAPGSLPVCLATVVVGGDRPALLNVAAKHRAAAAAGMRTRDVRLGGDATQAQLEAAVATLVHDPAVHGVFVQLPLPPGLREEPVLDLVPPIKDVDGLSAESLGRLVRGEQGHVPCTADAVLRLFARNGVATEGRTAVVVGHSRFVAVPVAVLLARTTSGCRVTLVGPDDPALDAVCADADLVVSAADRPRLIGAAHVRSGAAVVDAGVTRTSDGIVGDVDVDAVAAKAAAVAPTPGGVGPATIGCLLDHTVAAARALAAVRVLAGR